MSIEIKFTKWKPRAERTCSITKKQEEWQDNYHVRNYEFSCGHTIAWAHIFDPCYCPICGAKVIEQ